ncbi:tetratricopeptide repeat protein [Bacteroidota bacterium]
MKIRWGKIVFVLLLAGISFSFSALAQPNSKNNDLCKRYYSIYKVFYDIKEYDEAQNAWNSILAECPSFSPNIYINGVKMIKFRIKRETDIVIKEQLVDTLLMLYDMRIIHFGDAPKYPEGYILGEKGHDILKYRMENVEEAYNILLKSINLQGDKSKAHVILSFMLSSRELYKLNLISEEEVIDNYSKCMEIAEANISEKSENSSYISAKEGIEKHFTRSGAADCEALTNLFEKKFVKDPGDLKLLKKITSYLIKYKCTDSQLFFDVTEATYSIEPSSETAHNIARRYIIKENYDKAFEYLEKSIDLETSEVKKSLYYYELSQLYYIQKADYKTARLYANKSIEMNPDWGAPYILIGKIYISSYNEFSEDDFIKSTVFWTAIDKFITAKSVDKSVEDEASDLIRQYSEYFPSAKNIFFNTLKVGDLYHVKGWINEKTRIRARI